VARAIAFCGLRMPLPPRECSNCNLSAQDAMKLSFESAALLLLIAAVVAMLTRRLRLPYSAGLVAAGMGWRCCRSRRASASPKNSCSRRFFLR